MSKKVKDLLLAVAKKINNPAIEAATAASDLREVEFSDEDFEAISGTINSFLTPDAALSNPQLIEKYKEQVHPTIKNSIYEDIDLQLDEVGSSLGVDFGDAKKVREKLAVLKEYKPKGGKPTEELESYKKDVRDLNAKIREQAQSYENKLKEIQGGFESEKTKWALVNKLNKFQLADAYTKDTIRKGIYDSVIGEINSKATVKVTETGDIELFQKEYPDKQIYGDNNLPVTFDDFAGSLMKDYIKKSDPAPPSPTPSPRQSQPSNNMMDWYKSRKTL